MQLKHILLIVPFMFPFALKSQHALTSPDGNLRFSIQVQSGIPAYSITYKNKPVIADATLGLEFLDGGKMTGLKSGKSVSSAGAEEYELFVGKVKLVKDRFRETILPLTEQAEPYRSVNFIARVFNDGVAFRYEFLPQENRDSFRLTDEKTTFRFVLNPKVLALFLPGFTTSHEGLYTSIPLDKVKNDTLMDMPALFELPGNIYVAITEAALRDYAGMYLSKKNGVLTSTLSPWPGQQQLKVKAGFPHKSPWRVLLISDRMGAIIESNILTSLNEPTAISDLSWIKPGMSTFPWWNGTIVPDSVSWTPGNNFETNKYYIDFCSRNNIAYHSVVEHGGHEWYTNDGENYQPGPNADVTKPVQGLDMKAICDYASAKGVGVRVWVHWQALYPKLDEAFALFEKWGLKGMMVDFMDRDDQQMVNIQEEILKKAARHKLHIQFHGAYKPTGMHRTYPNEFTREGTLNYEVNKWDTIMNADHDINIPFTRMLAGSTDYHLGGFRAVAAKDFRVQYLKPLMMSTRCHMLAMYVVLENYQGMLCDYPEAYEGQPGFDFLREVPVTWDEIRVLHAVPGKYICIARRRNNDWYIGAITNREARNITVDLGFLGTGTFNAEIYTDAADAGKHPDHLKQRSMPVTKKSTIALPLAIGGGTVIHLKKSP